MVSRLATRLEIPMEEVICVGDSYNDLSMIEDAGLGNCCSQCPKAGAGKSGCGVGVYQ